MVLGSFARNNLWHTKLMLWTDTAQKSPNKARVLSGLGLSYWLNGQYDDAAIVFKKALELDTTLYSAAGTLGLIYDAVDSLELAVNYYRQAIRVSDSAAVYMNNLAYTWAVRGLNLEDAKALSAKSLKKAPDNGSYMDTMGWIEFGLGNDHDALEWLKRAAKLTPTAAEVHEHIGDVYQRLGQASKAKAAYRRALDLDPENENLKAKLAS